MMPAATAQLAASVAGVQVIILTRPPMLETLLIILPLAAIALGVYEISATFEE